eukprot:2902351-Prymnesium_polylepis.1
MKECLLWLSALQSVRGMSLSLCSMSSQSRAGLEHSRSQSRDVSLPRFTARVRGRTPGEMEAWKSVR